MLLQILKQDLRKRKGVNTILFIFITLATVFLASSVNNILTVSSAVDYYLDYANLPDVFMLSSTEDEKEAISAWLDEEAQHKNIQAWEYDELGIIPAKTLFLGKDAGMELDTSNASVYLSDNTSSFNKAYDEKGDSFQLQKGELALSKSVMQKNELKVDDTIWVRIKGVNTPFTIKQSVKDAAFGNDMIGMTRVFMSEEDFQAYKSSFDVLGLYNVDTATIDAFSEDISRQNFQSLKNKVTIDMYEMAYSFDMVIAGLLTAVGICLILIALLVLRFTLVFTMEEQYQEIGIMKAIGFRNFAIKKLYLMKYLVIVLVGSMLGFFLSIPIGEAISANASTNMIIKENSSNLWSNVLCTILIIFLVLFFCYFCTRKLNKISSITAIRGGASGERFRGYRGLHLAKRKRMSIATYLGVNDILCSLRRYMVLIITFCISFIIITIPLNTLHTMAGSEMIRRFMLDPESAVYVRDIELEENEIKTSKDLVSRMGEIKDELHEKGYEAELSAPVIYFLNYKDTQKDASVDVLTIQIVGEDTGYASYSKGYAPVLENEIAISEQILEQQDWKIGDSITTTIDGKAKEFIITGTYSDYTQLGKSARLNSKVDCGNEFMFDYNALMVNMESDQSQAKMVEEMSGVLPAYSWITADEVLDMNLGGMKNILGSMVLPMTFLLCGIIMLITLLMEKLFITREKGEIAMMKSIGFQRRTIDRWQLMRMFFVVVTSLLISIPLSFLSNEMILKPIFAIAGAQMEIEVSVWEVYGLYPAILLIGILSATWLATRGIRKIDIREMNNIE